MYIALIVYNGPLRIIVESQLFTSIQTLVEMSVGAWGVSCIDKHAMWCIDGSMNKNIGHPYSKVVQDTH